MGSSVATVARVGLTISLKSDLRTPYNAELKSPLQPPAKPNRPTQLSDHPKHLLHGAIYRMIDWFSRYESSGKLSSWWLWSIAGAGAVGLTATMVVGAVRVELCTFNFFTDTSAMDLGGIQPVLRVRH